MAATAAWGQLRDFERYAATDHFHADIQIDGGRPRSGARIEMTHRYLGIALTRVGRIVRWVEAPHDRPGFAFSDLSRRGTTVAFPHVLSMTLRDTTDGCTLRIRVGGRWTSPVPRWAARLWLRWVFAHIVCTTSARLLAYAVWRSSRPKP